MSQRYQIPRPQLIFLYSSNIGFDNDFALLAIFLPQKWSYTSLTHLHNHPLNNSQIHENALENYISVFCHWDYASLEQTDCVALTKIFRVCHEKKQALATQSYRKISANVQSHQPNERTVSEATPSQY